MCIIYHTYIYVFVLYDLCVYILTSLKCWQAEGRATHATDVWCQCHTEQVPVTVTVTYGILPMLMTYGKVPMLMPFGIVPIPVSYEIVPVLMNAIWYTLIGTVPVPTSLGSAVPLAEAIFDKKMGVFCVLYVSLTGGQITTDQSS